MRTEKHKGYLININHSLMDDPLEKKTLGTILCFHDTYKLGHTHTFKEAAEAWNYIKATKQVSVPLYLMPDGEDSILTTKVPAAKADTFMIGWIIAEPKAILKALEAERLGINVKRKAEQLLVDEVNVYNKYLHSEVFTYRIEYEGSFIKSESGFFTEEAAREDAHKVIEKLEKPVQVQKSKFAFLKHA